MITYGIIIFIVIVLLWAIVGSRNRRVAPIGFACTIFEWLIKSGEGSLVTISRGVLEFTFEKGPDTGRVAQEVRLKSWPSELSSDDIGSVLRGVSDTYPIRCEFRQSSPSDEVLVEGELDDLAGALGHIVQDFTSLLGCQDQKFVFRKDLTVDEAVGLRANLRELERAADSDSASVRKVAEAAIRRIEMLDDPSRR